MVRTDGFLTLEFAEMEKFAKLAAQTNTVNDYWCALAARPELYCLDIGAPSTLSNSLNTSAFDLSSTTVFSNGHFIKELTTTASNTSVNLFGQVDQCENKIVGDGLINVFDISSLLSYIFKDYQYANISPSPEQVFTVQGRERLPLQCEDTVTRGDYLSSYAYDTCVYFDDRPAAPPASPPSRRLSEESHALNASAIADRWLAHPLVPTSPPPGTTSVRAWNPVPYHTVELVPDNTLARADHTLLPEIEFDSGRWYTLRTASVSLRLQAVFTGLPPQEETELSNTAFDGSEPSDPSQRIVKFSRFCEFGRCDDTCAVIETSFSYRKAMAWNTLELVQRPISDACPFEVHVWVPKTSGHDHTCVGMEYLLISDGVRGAFARDTMCTRHLSSPPPPSTNPVVIALPPSPYLPPPLYAAYGNASSSTDFSPPSAPRKSSSTPFPFWVVGVGLMVLSCTIGSVLLYDRFNLSLPVTVSEASNNRHLPRRPDEEVVSRNTRNVPHVEWNRPTLPTLPTIQGM